MINFKGKVFKKDNLFNYYFVVNNKSYLFITEKKVSILKAFTSLKIEDDIII